MMDTSRLDPYNDAVNHYLNAQERLSRVSLEALLKECDRLQIDIENYPDLAIAMKRARYALTLLN